MASQFSAWSFLQVPHSSEHLSSGAGWVSAKLLERESIHGWKLVQEGLGKPRSRRWLWNPWCSQNTWTHMPAPIDSWLSWRTQLCWGITPKHTKPKSHCFLSISSGSFMRGQSELQFRAIFLYPKTAYHPLSGHWQKWTYKQIALVSLTLGHKLVY